MTWDALFIALSTVNWQASRKTPALQAPVSDKLGTAANLPKERTMSHDHRDSGSLRRDVLCAGGAAMLGYVVSALLGGAKPTRAQALRGPVPEVDRLAVRVVIDSYQLAIAPNIRVGEVEVERFGMPPAGKSLL
ncbi:MAG: hypothetical protein ACRECM_10980, partial [Methyloceanibacter sp.]